MARCNLGVKLKDFGPSSASLNHWFRFAIANELVLSCINFKRAFKIATPSDFLQVHREKGCNRSGIFVLKDVAALVRKQSVCCLIFAGINTVSESSSGHIRVN